MQKLRDSELGLVHGGSLWSEISKVFGRQGKPFIGRDLIEVAVGVATAATAGAAGAIPVAAGTLGKTAQSITSDIIDRKRGIDTDRGNWIDRIVR